MSKSIIPMNKLTEVRNELNTELHLLWANGHTKDKFSTRTFYRGPRKSRNGSRPSMTRKQDATHAFIAIYNSKKQMVGYL